MTVAPPGAADRHRLSRSDTGSDALTGSSRAPIRMRHGAEKGDIADAWSRGYGNDGG